MADDETLSTPHRSWLERLSQALLREPQDREQLVDLLRDAEQRNLLDEQALTMIEGVLHISETHVRDIMIPRAQMVVVESDTPPEKFLPLIIESGHSRFPVIGENRDEVIGILLAKDLLEGFNSQQITHQKFQLRHILRPVVFVPESKRLDKLLQEFRRNRNHMAIVIDEYGGVAGLVTIEDVLEQIVGDIEDEYDIDEELFIKQHGETYYSVRAFTPIEDFNHYFNAQLDDSEFDTIGGLVMHAFGHLPKRGETTVIGPFRFKVLHADNRRIRLLRVTIPKKPQEAEEENSSS
jgi:magnesium and cobalt transporter